MPKRSTFFHHLHPVTIPKREARFRYTFGLGGISVFLFVILVITGALELFYYIPSVEEANASVQVISFLVPYGWLVRGLHFWAAQALVVASGAHLLRVALTGSYKRPRRFNWLLGVLLLVGVLLLNFTGYALRWDEDIAWALLVGTNLLKSIPLIGPALHGTVVGGPEIGEATVVRFFGWHVFGLALTVFGIMVWHLFRVRRDGGISSAPPEAATGRRPERISRDELVRREALAMLVVIITLIALTLLFPPSLAPAGDFGQLPEEASAPWFFVWVQELLRLGEPFPMGVLIPVGLVIVLALIPYVVDRSESGVARWFNREGRRAQWVVLAMALLVIGLIIKGTFS
jgi:quinol-cytochrome oxidoreductase complex cytochrome b subunit